MKTVLTITRGVIRNQNSRRWTMFILILAATLILFFGATFLATWLTARPFLFLLYWGGCAWLTITALLLALFDMWNVRARARETKKRLRRKIFGEEVGD